MNNRLADGDHPVVSSQEQKRILLTSRLTLIFIGALATFAAIDFFSGYRYPFPYHAASMVAALGVLWLNRSGYHFIARALLVVIVITVTLFITGVLNRDIGIYMFSFCINVGMMVALGYERIKLSVALVAISSALFLVAMFHDWPRQPTPTDDGYLARHLAFSFCVATIVLIFIVYYLLRTNHLFEATLSAKEKAIARQNEELVKVNAELDRFFYSASHDLRAPLTSMQGLIQIMELTNNMEELRNYVELLKGRTHSLDRFILKIGEHARNARVDVYTERVRLLQVLRDAVENLRFFPHASQIKIIMNVPEDFELDTDPIRLQTIFGNLLSNAMKYHDFHKPDPFIRVSTLLRGDYVDITVEDNGTGIRKENLDRIFDMFFREHRRKEGTGLGLYIVRDAVRRLDGQIDVQSEYGKGSTFVVSLPLKRVAQSPVVQLEEPVAQTV